MYQKYSTYENVDDIIVLGTPAGSDEHIKVEMMELVVEKYDVMHTRLQGMRNAHSQYLLTRY